MPSNSNLIKKITPRILCSAAEQRNQLFGVIFAEIIESKTKEMCLYNQHLGLTNAEHLLAVLQLAIAILVAEEDFASIKFIKDAMDQYSYSRYIDYIGTFATEFGIIVIKDLVNKNKITKLIDYLNKNYDQFDVAFEEAIKQSNYDLVLTLLELSKTKNTNAILGNESFRRNFLCVVGFFVLCNQQQLLQALLESEFAKLINTDEITHTIIKAAIHEKKLEIFHKYASTKDSAFIADTILALLADEFKDNFIYFLSKLNVPGLANAIKSHELYVTAEAESPLKIKLKLIAAHKAIKFFDINQQQAKVLRLPAVHRLSFLGGSTKNMKSNLVHSLLFQTATSIHLNDKTSEDLRQKVLTKFVKG